MSLVEIYNSNPNDNKIINEQILEQFDGEKLYFNIFLSVL